MTEDNNENVGEEFGGVVDPDLGSITILVVDDKSEVRDTTISFLQMMMKNMPPVEFIEAVDGEDGLAQYQENWPDIVITDREMENSKAGFEMVRAIRDIQDQNPNNTIPIIVMQSGLGEMIVSEYESLAYEAGVDEGHAYEKDDSSRYKAVVRIAKEIAAGKGGQSASPSSEAGPDGLELKT